MHKIIGYFLLFVGLATLFFSFTGMYQTFVNKKPVVQIMQLKPLHLNTQYGAVQLDASAANQIINLSLFALFMIFLAGLGAKVASVGNHLLKTERICETLKEMKLSEISQKQKEIQKL